MQHRNKNIFSNFTKKELRILARLDSPQKIQDFLDQLPINFEENGETYLSPRQVLAQKKAHCAEGAIFAAVALWYHGQKPLLMDLKTAPGDFDHVVALFKQHGHWGGITKTNHAVLRYREPIYRTVRELVMSFFHEYFKDNGKKTLRSFSAPFDLSKIKNKSWLTTDKNLFEIIHDLDNSKHFSILNSKQIKTLRRASKTEIQAGKIVQFNSINKKQQKQ